MRGYAYLVVTVDVKDKDALRHWASILADTIESEWVNDPEFVRVGFQSHVDGQPIEDEWIHRD